MMWVAIIIIAILLFERLDDLIMIYKSKNPEYQQEQKQLLLEKESQRKELLQELEDLVGVEVIIKNHKLLQVGNYYDEIKGKIVQVDSDWIEILTIQKRKKIKVFLKVENIYHVSAII